MRNKKLLVVVLVVLVIVAVGAQLWTGADDPGVHQTDRDTVMDQAPTEPPSPPEPPAGRTGGGS
jgi:flagellar basal body-associated protein FliL